MISGYLLVAIETCLFVGCTLQNRVEDWVRVLKTLSNLKNEPIYKKEHVKISSFVKFEDDMVKR
jgi:hypothetical protein